MWLRFNRRVAKKKTEKPTVSPGDLPFEEALRKLELIVGEMEGDDLPLEKLLSQYEEGNRLVGACQEKLKHAELRIQKLEQVAGGGEELKPADDIEF